MNKDKTLFGCESLLPNFINQYNKAVDSYIYDKVSGAIRYAMPEIRIDRDKLVKWVNMCIKLDNIDKEASISLAIQRKFDEKDHKIEILEHALRTAIREEWCGCPDETVEEMFNFSLEKAEQSIRRKNAPSNL